MEMKISEMKSSRECSCEISGRGGGDVAKPSGLRN